MSKLPLTEEQKERISQGLIKFYKSEAGKARIRELKITPPPNKGKSGPEPWNKNKRGLVRLSIESRKKISDKARKKVILQYSKQGVFIKAWPSIIEAVMEYSLSYQSVWYCLTGRRKSAGGYVWRYN